MAIWLIITSIIDHFWCYYVSRPFDTQLIFPYLVLMPSRDSEGAFMADALHAELVKTHTKSSKQLLPPSDTFGLQYSHDDFESDIGTERLTEMSHDGMELQLKLPHHFLTTKLWKSPTIPSIENNTMSRRDIEFKASDGTILRGWFYVSTNLSEKAPCIILSHGVLLLLNIIWWLVLSSQRVGPGLLCWILHYTYSYYSTRLR